MPLDSVLSLCMLHQMYVLWLPILYVHLPISLVLAVHFRPLPLLGIGWVKVFFTIHSLQVLQSLMELDDEEVIDETTQLLDGLQRIELAICRVLQIAADAIETAAMIDEDDEDEDAAERFEQISTAYYTLLDKIQFGLRNSFHSLTRSGLLLLPSSAASSSTGLMSNTINQLLFAPYTASLQETVDLEMELDGLERLLLAHDITQ